jgi:cell division protein FtsI/penicillin-binding protein 2
MFNDYNIPDKANRVLNFISLCLLLLLLRVWYLEVPKRESYEAEAAKPKRRSLAIQAYRGPIYDRFSIPMAINKIQYNAAVSFAQIREIPAVLWVKEGKNKRKTYPRKEHISKIALCLSEELGLDAEEIEDAIYAKAAVFPNTPYVIQEDISEKSYYRLRMLERTLSGIYVQKLAKRFYPQGRVAADVVGYLGAISQQEHMAIAEEIEKLKTYLEQRKEHEAPFLPKGYHSAAEVIKRLSELEERAYTINDLVGKAGVEGKYDEQLRGYVGRKTFEVDVKGNYLRELPGSRRAIDGQSITLNLSSELQEHAEKLLAEYEQEYHPGDPWIKGGAIVAMIPQTGEVVAMASHPRQNPNDFVSGGERRANLLRWLENMMLLGEIWDGKRPFERECYSKERALFYDEKIDLNWDLYLKSVLSQGSKVFEVMQTITDLKKLFELQGIVQKLLEISGQEKMSVLIDTLYDEKGHMASRIPIALEEKRAIVEKFVSSMLEVDELKKKLEPYFGKVNYNDDKLLILDLCRIVAEKRKFSPELIDQFGAMSLEEYRVLSQNFFVLDAQLKKWAQGLFHREDFKNWRETSFKSYLLEKRREEKRQKKYARPYTEYLEGAEKEMFAEFWREHRLKFLQLFICGGKRDHDLYIDSLFKLREKELQIKSALSRLVSVLNGKDPELVLSFLATMRSFAELDEPLYGKYRNVRNENCVQKEKHLAAAFYPVNGFGYGASQAYRQSTPAGSVFKIVTAYAALKERFLTLERESGDLNPLTIIDEMSGSSLEKRGPIMGYFLNGQAIRKLYKSGSLPKGHPNIGKIDLKGALETSSNIYFSLLAVDCLKDPEALNEAARTLGYGEQTGIELYGEIAGNLPNDLAYNRTGLYVYAIGQHSLVGTPLQTAVMLSTLINEGKMMRPHVIGKIAGEKPSNAFAFEQLHDFPFKEALQRVGVDFPLFTQTLQLKEEKSIVYTQPDRKRDVFFPKKIQKMILEGMYAVINKEKGTARLSAIKTNPQYRKDYADLRSYVVGKTGTAEISYRPGVDAEKKAELRNHVWFGAISFKSPKEDAESWDDAELVVIVYLRYGKSGKEGAPLSMQMIKKWRELMKKYS